MPKLFEFEGQTFDFPDDVSDEEALSFIGKQAKPAPLPTPKPVPFGTYENLDALIKPSMTPAPVFVGPPSSLAPPTARALLRAKEAAGYRPSAHVDPLTPLIGPPAETVAGNVKQALHVPAQGLDELAGMVMGRTQDPGTPGGTAPGATGALLRKASVLSPLALPGHLARGAEAAGLPLGGFLRGGLEAIEEAGSTLATDPTNAAIPGHAVVAAAFLPDVAESLGTDVGELIAELDANGWKPTPELGEKLGKTGAGAAFLLMLGHGVYEGARPRGTGVPKLEAPTKLEKPLAALEDAGVTGERRSAERLEGLSTKAYAERFEKLDPVAKVQELERLHKQAYTDSLTQMGNRAAFVEKLNTPDAPPVMISWDVEGLKWANDNLPGKHQAGDAILSAVSSAFRDAGMGDGNTFRTGGDEFMSLALTPEAARTHIEQVQSRLKNSEFVVTEPDGTQHRYRDIRLWGGFDEAPAKGLTIDERIGRAEEQLAARKAEAVAAGARAERGARPRSLVEVPGEVAGGDQVPRGVGAARAPAESVEPAASTPPNVPPRPVGLGDETGALLAKAPEQPVAPIPGYDQIISARELAKKGPGLLPRIKEALRPSNIKEQLLQEEAPIFAAADEVAQAMGVPGKFDAETTPIPKDPRLMLPLLKNVGALARHDSIVLGRVQTQARNEGLLGYVTQYLDLLGGERRMSQAEAKVRELQRQSLTHEIGKRMKRPVSSALATESKAFTALGDQQLGGEARVKKSGTLEEARYQIGERLAKLKSDTAQNPALAKVLAGKFAGAKKQVAALQHQLQGGEVHPLFRSGKDVQSAFTAFESSLTPEQLTRVQELSAYVLDLHRRNLQLASRPSARYGGSANGLLTPEQYHELSSRLVGPGGTEYAPLNRILNQVEAGTGWSGGAGLTSQQRQWLQKYKTGSKNAPVDPFDAALASSMRLFSDLAHNAAADSIYTLGLQGEKAGVDVGIRKLKANEKPRADEIALAVRKKGQLIRFAAPAEFGPALMAKATPELSGLAVGTLRRARNLLREGVIQLYPFFAVSNVPVDVADAMLLGRVHTTKLGKYNPTKYLVGAAHWVAALKQTIAEKPEYMEALWHGALGSTFTHAARAERGATPLPGAPKGIGGTIRGVLEGVGQATEETTKVYGFQEALRRLKELEATGRKTTNPKELLAAYEAMKFVGTPDVLTHGKAIPEANVLLPFLNVGIQGTARMYRRFIRNPKEFLLPALATITASEAMLLAWNAQHDDGEGGRELDHVPQDEKDNYWSVILPESYYGRYAENGRLHRLKIRKPQPIRILAGPIRDILAGAFTATNPEMGKTLLNSMTEAQPIPGLHVDPNKPVSSLAKSMGAAQNPLVKLTLEQISNQDFLRGTPIERRAEEARAPSERYDERTSSTAVVLSQAITKAAAAVDRARGGLTDSEGRPRELLQDVVPSPKRIEHGVRTLTGGLGQMALGVMDPVMQPFSPQPARAREPVERIPILNDLLRRLVTLAPRDSQREKLTDAFYDRYDQVDEIVKTFPVLMKTNPERAQEFLQERGISDYGQIRGEYVAMVNASSALARLYKEARAAKTSVEAKRINDSINQLLKQVLEERKRRGSASQSGQTRPPSLSTMPSPLPEIDGDVGSSGLPPI